LLCFPISKQGDGNITLRQVKKYPIKGLAGVDLDRVELMAERGIAGDRKFAITTNADLDDSVWHSSRNFLINAINDGLLQLDLHWSGSKLHVSMPDGKQKCFDLDSRGGLDAFNHSLPALLSNTASSGLVPRLVGATGSMAPPGFWDYSDSQVSVMNLETLRAVSNAIGEDLDIDRFRGNLIIDGQPAWSEFGFAGSRFAFGDAEVEFTRPARRCPATAVNPTTGIRDIPVNSLIVEKFGHGYFGMYARVVKTGALGIGDSLNQAGASVLAPNDVMVQGAGPSALWPKLAVLDDIYRSKDIVRLSLAPVGPWPLVDEPREGSLKLHLGSQNTVATKTIQQISGEIRAEVSGENLDSIRSLSVGDRIVVTGPYGR